MNEQFEYFMYFDLYLNTGYAAHYTFIVLILQSYFPNSDLHNLETN